jgi:hypothetical protein
MLRICVCFQNILKDHLTIRYHNLTFFLSAFFWYWISAIVNTINRGILEIQFKSTRWNAHISMKDLMVKLITSAHLSILKPMKKASVYNKE